MEAYRYPQYYAIALAPSDPAGEIDFFEAAIEKFSRARVRQVFELGAGTAPYLEEWHKRGYAYCGLDLSPAMIEFGCEKARLLGIEAKFVLGDMRELDRNLGPFHVSGSNPKHRNAFRGAAAPAWGSSAPHLWRGDHIRSLVTRDSRPRGVRPGGPQWALRSGSSTRGTAAR